MDLPIYQIFNLKKIEQAAKIQRGRDRSVDSSEDRLFGLRTETLRNQRNYRKLRVN